MDMVTPSPAPLLPLESPRRLPSARLDDESDNDDSEGESEGEILWSEEVEEAIAAANKSEPEKGEIGAKEEKAENKRGAKSAGEKASEKRNRAVVLVSEQVKSASVEQICIESPDILGIDNKSVCHLGDLLARTPTEAGVVVAGDFNLPRGRACASPPARHRNLPLPDRLPPLQRPCLGRLRS